jgi:hypothetical protein
MRSFIIYALHQTLLGDEMKERGMGHVARMGEMRNAYKFQLEYLKGRDHFEDLGLDGKIILEWMLGK